MTVDEIFKVQNMVCFLENQRLVQKKREFSQIFVPVLSVLCDRYIPEYRQFVPQDWVEQQKQIISSQYGTVAKAIRKLHRKLFGSRIDYRPLLMEELFVMSILCRPKGSVMDCHGPDLLTDLGWKEKDVQNYGNKLAKIPEYILFSQFTQQEKYYFSLPKFNIAVCANMSAGKSTFINALLGHDYLPSRNEATTATITTVQDKDDFADVLGCVQVAGKIVPCREQVTLKLIDRWNDSQEVKRIYLQGDLDNIGNNHAVVCVHDTPGTNNSGDISHNVITMDFLQKNPLDALIFVANGEHLCTTDERRLLEEVKKISTEKNIPVIFAMNKMDSHDSEKEELATTVGRYRDFVKEIGFDDSMVYPVSAKAARLFKMALKGCGKEFTAKERADFNFCLKLMVEDTSSSGVGEIVEIGKHGYSAAIIRQGLEQSGIVAIEQAIENLVNHR